MKSLDYSTPKNSSFIIIFFIYYKTTSEYYAISRHTTIHVILYKRILIYLPANLVSDAVYAPVTAEIPIHES